MLEKKPRCLAKGFSSAPTEVKTDTKRVPEKVIDNFFFFKAIFQFYIFNILHILPIFSYKNTKCSSKFSFFSSCSSKFRSFSSWFCSVSSIIVSVPLRGAVEPGGSGRFWEVLRSCLVTSTQKSNPKKVKHKKVKKSKKKSSQP